MSIVKDEHEELLAILSEESGEITQEVGKIFRHGVDSHNPATGLTNRQSLEREIGDILLIIGLLSEKGYIDDDNVNEHMIAKRERLKKWSHFINFD